MTGKLLRVYPSHIVLDHCGRPCWVIRNTINRLLHEYGYRAKVHPRFWGGWKIRTTARKPITWPRRQSTVIIPRDQL